MDLSKLSAADRRIVLIAAVAAVCALTSIVDRWGGGVTIALLALVALLASMFLPQLAPATKLPVTRGIAVLGLGGIAAIGFALSALQYLEYVLRLGSVYTILFDVGLVLSVVLAYLGWLAYSQEKGTAVGAPPPAPPAA